MYSKILVPLDGSKLAECVLEHLETVASGCGTQEVILVSVTEAIKVKQNVKNPERDTIGYQILSDTGMSSLQVPGRVQDTMMGGLPVEEPAWTKTIGRMYNEADRYLDRIQRRLIKKGINSRTEVLISNDVAGAIVGYADKTGVDLIVMASHGRSGISRWTSGSVADRVFRSSCIPVLMVRAPGCVAGI
jgi:nucleotide-binding universal stress UspA family protein